jgi:thiosulfate/3-mercaptopyruvate sulfurtransferase
VLAILGLLAAASVEPIVSTDWLQAHLTDPQVRIIFVGSRDAYARAHILGARLIEHMDTVEMGANGHRLARTDTLVRVFTKAGVADDVRVVLYGDSPMATGWVNTALTSIGHGDTVSWLDGGIVLWQSEKRPVETATPAPGTGPLTIGPAPDFIVDAAWVRGRLNSPTTKILDVRTQGEYRDGHMPTATLILWQDLFADLRTQRFKSVDEIRTLLARAGVGANQEAVTYCAVGMRASLMAWAARAAGVPTRVYLGSWQDWSSNSANPIVR